MPRRSNAFAVSPTGSQRRRFSTRAVFAGAYVSRAKASRCTAPPANVKAAFSSQAPAFCGSVQASGTSTRPPAGTRTVPARVVSASVHVQATSCSTRRSFRMTSVFRSSSPGR